MILLAKFWREIGLGLSLLALAGTVYVGQLRLAAASGKLEAATAKLEASEAAQGRLRAIVATEQEARVRQNAAIEALGASSAKLAAEVVKRWDLAAAGEDQRLAILRAELERRHAELLARIEAHPEDECCLALEDLREWMR
jgi:hypothetical protein